MRNVRSRNKLNKRQSVETDQVTNKDLATASAEITGVIDERVTSHTPIAYHLETLLVRIRLGAALEVCEINLLLPLCRNLELLHLVVSDSGCLKSLKSESKDAQGVVYVHLGNSKWLSLAKVADQES